MYYNFNNVLPVDRRSGHSALGGNIKTPGNIRSIYLSHFILNTHGIP